MKSVSKGARFLALFGALRFMARALYECAF